MHRIVLDISVLPESAQAEIIDFYEFLKMKYNKENPNREKIDWASLVPREVEPFKPMTRDELYVR